MTTSFQQARGRSRASDVATTATRTVVRQQGASTSEGVAQTDLTTQQQWRSRRQSLESSATVALRELGRRSEVARNVLREVAAGVL